MGNSVFNPQEVAQAEILGFQYIPGQAPVFNPIQANATGLVVGVRLMELNSPAVFFQDLSEDNFEMRAIYALPGQVDARWQELVSTADKDLGQDTNALKLSQGFLTYAYQCLEFLYRTANGRTVLDAIRQSQRRVNILPSNMGNQISGASGNNAFPPLARRILNPASRFTNVDGLVDLAHGHFNGDDANDSLRLMANAMNSMPLYSLFKAAPYEYSPPQNAPSRGFLGQCYPVRIEELLDWFEAGDESYFARRLQNGMNMTVNAVSVLDYTRLATLIALGDTMPAGTGSNVTVMFNTKYNANYYPQNRPPAIGLGHELTHAYWAITGRQLGYDLDSYSTLLFELKCVGLGPWAGNNISDNGIRAGWGAARQAGGMGNYNDVAVPNRDIYEAPESDNAIGREKARKEFHTI
jgi:hypothetical protein